MRFQKIGWDGESTNLIYDIHRDRGEEYDKRNERIFDRPRDSFLAAMAALLPHAQSMWPDDQSAWLAGAQVSFLQIVHKKNRWGVRIGLSQELPGCTDPCEISTPLVNEVGSGVRGIEILMTDELRKQVLLVIEEAEKYIAGDRQQMTLDQVKNDPEPAVAA